MGSHAQHQSKAEHNGRFLASINAQEFPDWAVVVAFYKAVHLVEMLLAKAQSFHSDSHREKQDTGVGGRVREFGRRLLCAWQRPD